MPYGRHRLTGPSRTTLLASAAALAMAQAPSARAQDGAAPGDEELALPADAASLPDGSSTFVGNEIVVTATKREQTLQEIPVAVSVTTAETIERAQIRDITDLQSVVPSLRVTQANGQFATTYNIRGFGTSGNNIGLEPSVAVFVDGVYRSRALAQIGDFPDIQRVEVLRGPQSTLFGKNASAGLISIVTRKPQFSFGGTIEASYGNRDAVVVKGVVTGPLAEGVAASLAAGYNRRDGFLRNLATGTDVNDRNRGFVRGQLLFEPTETLSVRLIGDYDKIDEICCGVLNLRRSAATAAVEAVGGRVNDFRDPFADVIFSDVDPVSKVRNWGLSGQIDYAYGPLNLTSITAYRDTRLRATQDVDFTSARLATGANIGQADVRTFTQELRLATNLDGPVNALLGAYYFREKVRTGDQIIYGPDFRAFANILIGGPITSPPNDLAVDSIEAQFSALTGRNFVNQFFQQGQGFFNSIRQKDEAFSIFGNVDFKVTDALTLTVGANYTHDAKNVSTNSVSTDVFSSIDLTALRATATSFGIAQTVGQILRVPGGIASAAQVASFAAAQPVQFAQIQTGAANASAPIAGLAPFQFLRPFVNFPNAVEDGRTRDGDWSYTIRLAYEVNDHLNVYASYATGFKASSFNLSRDSRPTLADLPAIRAAGLAVPNLDDGARFADPENSSVYELGIKGNWGVAAANLTIFKQSIKDFQDSTFLGSGFVLGNAGKQSTFGIEFDGFVHPTPELTLSLAMTYLDPQFDSYPNSPFGDRSGEKIKTTPPLRANFGAQWDQPLANDDHIIARADFEYEAPVQVAVGLANFVVSNPDGTRNLAPARLAAAQFRSQINNLNASLTYAMARGIELSVWGRNLLDDRYITDIFDSVAQRQSVSGYPNQPRTYGVGARYRF
ncbi:MAG: TonB-dependent receptor [Novosphingobium sp.]